MAEDSSITEVVMWLEIRRGFLPPEVGQALEQVSQGNGTKPHRAEGTFGEFSHLVGFLGCPELVLVSPN